MNSKYKKQLSNKMKNKIKIFKKKKNKIKIFKKIDQEMMFSLDLKV